MLGSNQLTYSATGIVFNVRGSRSVSRVAITLAPNDTYSVMFCQVKGAKIKTWSYHDVYVAQLHDLIEIETGLYCKIGENPK